MFKQGRDGDLCVCVCVCVCVCRWKIKQCIEGWAQVLTVGGGFTDREWTSRRDFWGSVMREYYERDKDRKVCCCVCVCACACYSLHHRCRYGAAVLYRSEWRGEVSGVRGLHHLFVPVHHVQVAVKLFTNLFGQLHKRNTDTFIRQLLVVTTKFTSYFLKSSPTL